MYLNLTRITATLHLIISRSFLLRIKNTSNRGCRENQNSHFTFNNIKKNLTIYTIMCKNISEPDRPQMAV